MGRARCADRLRPCTGPRGSRTGAGRRSRGLLIPARAAIISKASCWVALCGDARAEGDVTVKRIDEVRHLLKMPPGTVIKQAGARLRVCDDLEALYGVFAGDIADEICRHNELGKATRMILPATPMSQYAILAEVINRREIDLSRCWFFFVGEYCDASGRALLGDHGLSVKRLARRTFFDRLRSNSGLKKDQIIYPGESNIARVDKMIDKEGRIDTCYCGVGLRGQRGFNEPGLHVGESVSRRAKLSETTRIISVIRGHVAGNLEGFPTEAYTLGMRQILGARKIRIFCRSGSADWANTVLRLALFGEPGDDYPVTHIRHHEYLITTDRHTLVSPKYII